MSSRNRRSRIRIAGPDDVDLVIRPAPDRFIVTIFPPTPISPALDCYLWSIHNRGLRSLERVELEISNIQSYDDRKSALREPINVGFRWPLLRDIGAGAWTDQTTLFRVDGNHVRLSTSEQAGTLPWPKGDQSPIRRWLLTMSVIGLSKEWPIKLDLRWALDSQTLELTEYPMPDLTKARRQEEQRANEFTGPHPADPMGPHEVKPPQNGHKPLERDAPVSLGNKGKRGKSTRGRKPNEERFAAVRIALSKYERWREHLPEIFSELDTRKIDLGDFLGKKLDLGEGEFQVVEKWEHLDLALGKDRSRILDALRKYSAQPSVLGRDRIPS